MTLCRSEHIPLPRHELERVREDSRTALARLVEALEQTRTQLYHAERQRNQLHERLQRALRRDRSQRWLIGELRRQRSRRPRPVSDEQLSLPLEGP